MRNNDTRRSSKACLAIWLSLVPLPSAAEAQDLDHAALKSDSRASFQHIEDDGVFGTDPMSRSTSAHTAV